MLQLCKSRQHGNLDIFQNSKFKLMASEIQQLQKIAILSIFMGFVLIEKDSDMLLIYHTSMFYQLYLVSSRDGKNKAILPKETKNFTRFFNKTKCLQEHFKSNFISNYKKGWPFTRHYFRKTFTIVNPYIRKMQCAVKPENKFTIKSYEVIYQTHDL